jgi:hypothetical protein
MTDRDIRNLGLEHEPLLRPKAIDVRIERLLLRSGRNLFQFDVVAVQIRGGASLPASHRFRLRSSDRNIAQWVVRPWTPRPFARFGEPGN